MRVRPPANLVTFDEEILNRKLDFFVQCLKQNDSYRTFISNAFLFGITSPDDSSNRIILNATINYIISTKRFDDSILNHLRGTIKSFYESF